jgi:hypothetical protein
MLPRWITLAADTESLRRSLTRQDSIRSLKDHETILAEDLSGYSRTELEDLVRQLRSTEYANAMAKVEERAAIRDMMSHSATGKDANDHLHLNLRLQFGSVHAQTRTVTPN